MQVEERRQEARVMVMVELRHKVTKRQCRQNKHTTEGVM